MTFLMIEFALIIMSFFYHWNQGSIIVSSWLVIMNHLPSNT